MISKTIGFRGTNHFQTNPYRNICHLWRSRNLEITSHFSISFFRSWNNFNVARGVELDVMAAALLTVLALDFATTFGDWYIRLNHFRGAWSILGGRFFVGMDHWMDHWMDHGTATLQQKHQTWINMGSWWLMKRGLAVMMATLRPWLEVKPIHLLYSDLALIKFGWDMSGFNPLNPWIF